MQEQPATPTSSAAYRFALAMIAVPAFFLLFAAVVLAFTVSPWFWLLLLALVSVPFLIYAVTRRAVKRNS